MEIQSMRFHIRCYPEPPVGRSVGDMNEPNFLQLHYYRTTIGTVMILQRSDPSADDWIIRSAKVSAVRQSTLSIRSQFLSNPAQYQYQAISISLQAPAAPAALLLTLPRKRMSAVCCDLYCATLTALTVALSCLHVS